jgi:antitoxin ParD1/3/4
MGVVRKTISMDKSQDDWVKSQVASGRFASDSEVYRALVKDIQAREAKLKWLEKEVQKGLDSPMSDQTPQEIIAEFKNELRAKGEL